MKPVNTFSNGYEKFPIIDASLMPPSIFDAVAEHAMVGSDVAVVVNPECCEPFKNWLISEDMELVCYVVWF